MPRAKKSLEQTEELVENQVIVAPIIDTNEHVVLEIENTVTEFQKPLKKFGVYKNGEFLQEVDENSDLINEFLDSNKKELEKRIILINELVTDPNVLIFFHEGKQSRTYMSYEAFYSQNGLAPKPLKYDTWAKYYRSVNSSLSDEEIALHKFGNLSYSFVILESEN